MSCRRAFLAVLLLLVAPISVPVVAAQETPICDDEVNVISFEEMRYPPIAQSANGQGVVVVAVTLDEKGNAIDASVVFGTRYFISDVLANVTKWTFAPNAQKRAVIVYDFTVDGGCLHTSQSLFRFVHKNVVRVTTCLGPM